MGQESDREAAVWSGMADPHRRRLLELLRTRPRTTGQLAHEFDISRIAVMRHLRVLEEAGLVLSRKRGRERWHYLNAIPLERLYRRWVGRLEAGWARALLDFETGLDRVDEPMAGTRGTTLSIDLEQALTVRRPRSEVFDALTRRVSSWWGPPYVSQATTDLRLDPHVGGAFEEIWGQAGGRLLATVTMIESDRILELTGPMHLGVVYGVVRFQLSDKPQGTLVQFSHRGIGVVAAEEAETFSSGWKELLTVRLVALVERGVELGITAKKR